MIVRACNSLCIQIDHFIERLNKEGRGWRWRRLGSSRRDFPQFGLIGFRPGRSSLSVLFSGSRRKKIQTCLDVVSQENANLLARLRAEKRRAKLGRADSVCFVEDELFARIIPRNRHGKSEAQQQPQQAEQPALERAHLTLPALYVWSSEMPQAHTKAGFRRCK